VKQPLVEQDDVAGLHVVEDALPGQVEPASVRDLELRPV
jgi:hypothetical protein